MTGAAASCCANSLQIWPHAQFMCDDARVVNIPIHECSFQILSWFKLYVRSAFQ